LPFDSEDIAWISGPVVDTKTVIMNTNDHHHHHIIHVKEKRALKPPSKPGIITTIISLLSSLPLS
jgi:hypothetical protein